jgi:hypothetical protein
LFFENLDPVLQNLQLRRRTRLIFRHPIKAVTEFFNFASYTFDLSPHVIHGRFGIGELGAQRVPIFLHVLEVRLGRTATPPEGRKDNNEQNKRRDSHWYNRRI